MTAPSPRGAVRLGLVQMRAREDPVENLAHAIRGIEEAARRGAAIVCLQELFRSRYFCQQPDPSHFALAEPVPGPSTEALAKVAAGCGVSVVAPLFERRGSGLYHNTAVTLDPAGRLCGRYRKMHVPDDTLYQEKFYFAPGDLGFPCVDTPAARIATLVCWDQWFPEAARLSALGGCELLLYPTAIGWQQDEGADTEAAQLDAWETIQRSHAIANGIFVAAVNRVGEEGGIRFWGRSFVVDPFGRVLARARADREEVLVVECDLAEIERARQEWPFLRDRRIDAYAGLSKRFDDPR